MEVVMAAYEVSTVVTDVILNREYIKRKWLEEYVLSLAFLGFSGFVMGLVGIALERRLPPRYARGPALNTLAAFVLGLMQLRVLTETLYVFAAERRAKAATRAQLPAPGAAAATAANPPPPPPPPDDTVSVKRLQDGLRFAAFVQAIVRDIPLFIIQANATIHYRKWQPLDLWAVTSTGLTLLLAVAAYVCKRDTGALRAAGSFFLAGQFAARAGAILLVAMTTKLLVLQYAAAITASSVLWSTVLRTAHTDRNGAVNLTRALLFFPFFTLFVVDASRLTSRRGSTRQTLLGAKLWPLHGWRFLECVAGALFAVYADRYEDFGAATDAVIVRAAAICGGVYVISLAVCVGVALLTLPTKDEALYREPSVGDDDSPVITQQQEAHHPHAAYSTMAAQA
ncbi:hypothetical protein PybrP1_005845 [[Pythium] brassicae (nom. inval.)]|nr:hypothetical protein PybrP1_005845 [[Pythium] brassicae (nom. inval.)]